MITNYCVVCGNKNDLYNHHFIPLSMKEGEDKDNNIITLCNYHHNFIHRIESNLDIRKLQKINIKRKVDNGEFFGGKKPFAMKLVSTGKKYKNKRGQVKSEIRLVRPDYDSEEFKILKFIHLNKSNFSYRKLEEVILENFKIKLVQSYIHKLYHFNNEYLKKFKNELEKKIYDN